MQCKPCFIFEENGDALTNYKSVFDLIRDLYPTEGPVYLHGPLFAGKELEFLMQVLKSKAVSTAGPFSKQFEIALTEHAGVKHAVALSSGTSALHLALKLVGLKPGEEVITQALTYVATINPIAYEGGIPIFLDVDRDTMGLSPVALRMFIEEFCEVPIGIGRGDGLRNKRTGRRISACMPMHTYGYPCRIAEIAEICKEYNIPLIEDAAEAVGSSYEGTPLGAFGVIGAFSFNGNKVVTTGGGGAIVTNDEKLAIKARHLSTQAKVPHAWESEHDEIGYNYRMPSLNAAVGVAQLENLESTILAKRQLADKYQKVFRQQDLDFIQEIEGAKANYWLNAMVMNHLEDRNAFLQAAHDQSIECRSLWKLMSDLPMFSHCETDSLENSRYLQERVVALPSSIPSR